MSSGSENLDPTVYSPEVLQLKVQHINGRDDYERRGIIEQIRGVLLVRRGDATADSENIRNYYTGWSEANKKSQQENNTTLNRGDSRSAQSSAQHYFKS